MQFCIIMVELNYSRQQPNNYDCKAELFCLVCWYIYTLDIIL